MHTISYRIIISSKRIIDISFRFFMLYQSTEIIKIKFVIWHSLLLSTINRAEISLFEFMVAIKWSAMCNKYADMTVSEILLFRSQWMWSSDHDLTAIKITTLSLDTILSPRRTIQTFTWRPFMRCLAQVIPFSLARYSRPSRVRSPALAFPVT